MAEISSVLRKQLDALLGGHGFKRQKALAASRIRDVFVDSVAIQVGRGALYIHHHVNLLADPTKAGDFSGYRVGERLHRNPHTGSQWILPAEGSMGDVVSDIIKVVEEFSLSFFSEVSTIERFVVELVSDVNYRARLSELDLAIALAMLGKRNKAIQICEENSVRLRERVSEGDVAASRIVQYCADLRSAYANGNVDELIADWAGANMRLLSEAGGNRRNPGKT